MIKRNTAIKIIKVKEQILIDKKYIFTIYLVWKLCYSSQLIRKKRISQ